MEKTNAHIERQIIQEYINGNTMLSIAKEYGISNTTVMNILDRNGVEKRTHGGIYKIDAQSVVNMYKQGQPCTTISKKFNVCERTITNILEKEGVSRNNIYHNLTLDENYWETIDRADKAYFLGFLITDGNVCGNNISLSLHSKDEHILKTFVNKTGNSNPIFKEKRREMRTYHVKRSKWVEDLAKYGVKPRKTYTAYMPTISENMMPHFIRGLIDGDGWITYKSHAIGFCGNIDLVTGLRDYLHNKLGVYKVKVLHTGKHLWQVVWSGKKDIQKIGAFIYENKGDCYLRRKYNNYCEIIHANTEVSTAIAKGAVTP